MPFHLSFEYYFRFVKFMYSSSWLCHGRKSFQIKKKSYNIGLVFLVKLLRHKMYRLDF